MAKLTLELHMDNAAFESDPMREVARILRYFADRITDSDRDTYDLRDHNGNVVGVAVFDDEDSVPEDGDCSKCPRRFDCDDADLDDESPCSGCDQGDEWCPTCEHDGAPKIPAEEVMSMSEYAIGVLEQIVELLGYGDCQTLVGYIEKMPQVVAAELTAAIGRAEEEGKEEGK